MVVLVEVVVPIAIGKVVLDGLLQQNSDN